MSTEMQELLAEISEAAIRAANKIKHRFFDILMGSRDALEFWQSVFAIWWGVAMFKFNSEEDGIVYKELIELMPHYLWAFGMTISGIMVVIGLFAGSVLNANGRALLLRKWGMTVHFAFMVIMFSAESAVHGILGSTVIAAFGVLMLGAGVIAARHWLRAKYM